jgi:Tfp pilus assembly protein PilF
VGALALRESGRAAEARQLLDQWVQHDPSNDLAQWSLAVFLQQEQKVSDIEKRLQSTLLNKSNGDQEFVLVAEVARMLHWAAPQGQTVTH